MKIYSSSQQPLGVLLVQLPQLRRFHQIIERIRDNCQHFPSQPGNIIEPTTDGGVQFLPRHRQDRSQFLSEF